MKDQRTSKGKSVPKEKPVMQEPMDHVTEEEVVTLPKATKKAKVKTSHYYDPAKDRTGCGKWAADPSLTLAHDENAVTCKACLASLTAKPKAKKEPKPDVEITCSVCGESRWVKASQAHVVTRCELHQKAEIKRKRRTKAKERKERKGKHLTAFAQTAFDRMLEEGATEKELRALASYIYKITAKIIKD